ncbi:MAG: hypothetical protein DYG98_12795 [Haliscomenobacteraceae bacterium CHB4]|nr:hypothetical protein [Saprospiraceae bacterium]MCE7923928.1 hypothetical protein [Haliscomenobacteraceae bacterium CHB4]
MEKRKRPPLPLDASPQEKYDNFILAFYEDWQEFDGEKIDCKKLLQEIVDLEHLGFHNKKELVFYLSSLCADEILAPPPKEWDTFGSIKIPFRAYITFKGLNYCRSLLESGKNSTRCFVAMKYSDDLEPYYAEGMAKAIEDNGFRPIRVDKEHTENEQTINDFIIASIKQSRFCVADLTHKSHGAYFEAGYALGRGLPVIYTCRNDHFEDIHFDLKNMQIIKYATPEELREALSLKIQAKISE